MSISVIIPTSNEARSIAECIHSLRSQQPGEIIVSDGGSTDDTVALSAAADAVVLAPRGRGVQMNHGAARARGNVLVFLHADCTLEAGALAEAERLLRRRRFIAGCFRMRVQADGLLYRSIDLCATGRVRLTGISYGDQGLFLRRDDFERLGGFPRRRFMEDVLMSRRLRRHGRIAVAERRVFVSPRRWQRTGLVRQTLHNWLLTAAALAGVHPDRLARFYPVVR